MGSKPSDLWGHEFNLIKLIRDPPFFEKRYASTPGIVFIHNDHFYGWLLGWFMALIASPKRVKKIENNFWHCTLLSAVAIGGTCRIMKGQARHG